jgi:hypothetical protein
MDLNAPHIFGMIKLHKPQNPIRPIVNWKGSPSYKLAKFITSKLKEIIQLPNIYNIQNSINLIENLNKLDINEDTRLCSFNISNMYTNIPLTETINIIQSILNRDQQTPLNIKRELITLLNATLEQNYIQFNDEYYKQNDGVAMGAPISAILAEVFIQHLEHNKIINILKKPHIIDYYRYVDDILIVYNTRATNTQNTNRFQYTTP